MTLDTKALEADDVAKVVARLRRDGAKRYESGVDALVVMTSGELRYLANVIETLSAIPSRNDILEAEQVELAAEGICRATALEWDSLDDSSDDDQVNDDGPETKEWFRYLARAAIRALVKP